jgi:hypothetical protein
LIDFDQVYETDLRYAQDCWKLCGDAHCCSFSRYKSRFRLVGRSPFQELPLLPGEYEFLRRKGWLTQFRDFEHKVIEYPLDHRVIRAESIISTRPQCACDQGTRTTICRLYPVLPVLDVSGSFIGADVCGIYEELENLAGLSPACQIQALPIRDIEKLLTIVNAIANSPLGVFQLMAYRLAKNHVSARLEQGRAKTGRDVFALFEAAFLKKQLFDHDKLRRELINLADAFDDHYGDRLSMGTSPVHGGRSIERRETSRRTASLPIDFAERRLADRRLQSTALAG